MKKILSIMASALLIASCTSQTEELVDPIPESQEPEGQTVTLCATIASDDGAANAPKRVSGKDSNPGSTTGVINLTWDAGDEVLVKVGEESAVFTLSSGAGTKTGSFTGVMPGEGSSYDVVYPADYNEAVLAEQTYVENGFGKGLMKMSTKTPGTVEGGFTLSADNALLGLQLTGNDELGKIVLSNPADSKTYTLNCTGVKLTSEAKVFYIVVPAGEWVNGFNVSVYASDDTRIGLLSKGSSTTFAVSGSMIMPVQEAKICFSVSENKQVIFSPGNLQYHPKNDEWRFAENQYDRIGEDNKNISTDYDGWIDLFGWSSTGSVKFGVSSSKNANDYAGDFVDWGKNQIGSDAPDTWRTLTNDEWKYLRLFRKNANSLRGYGQINGVIGVILLPDNWTCPVGVTFDSSSFQKFTIDEWSRLEAEGAVFLPCGGMRYGSTVSNVKGHAIYWSSTEYDSSTAHVSEPKFDGIGAYYINLAESKDNFFYRHSGYSVRLVKDL